ncbi:MAG: primosomal protein N' [Pseudomonadota bacterium]|nr:primosomal protein N' [Pseudomonadota bacterium]
MQRENNTEEEPFDIESTKFNKGDGVSVLLPKTFDKSSLDYLIPISGLGIGDFVEIPLGSKKSVGVIWERRQSNLDYNKLKYISRAIDIQPMDYKFRRFLTEFARYNLIPLGKAFRLVTAGQDLLSLTSYRKTYQSGKTNVEDITARQREIVSFFKQNPEQKFSMKQLIRNLKTSSTTINALCRSGHITCTTEILEEPDKLCVGSYSHSLSDKQKVVSNKLKEAANSNLFKVTLLRGVTGSGKTEVYMDAISATLDKGKQALVLMPEIALTIDLVKRVGERFGMKPSEWHSGISLADRKRLFKAVSMGKVNLIVGARSALFLPFLNLGLIVVDEEHDSSFKQEEGVCYNARDMAVLRGSTGNFPVILSSATPSLESWVNAEKGKYDRVDLTHRYRNSSLPKISILNLREDELEVNNWISNGVKSMITSRLEAGEQSLLFLNRRGYAPITVCKSCANQLGCPVCDTRLVQHSYGVKLLCHLCGFTAMLPNECPKCMKIVEWKAVGPGVERLAEECLKLFPSAKVGILSSDNIQNNSILKEKIREFSSGKVDIIIGTQLISKGHNFPYITFVGVIDADLSLQGGDLRAAEKTFQLLRQVSGRAGRGKRPGEAIVQTYEPENLVLRSIVDYNDEKFWKLEASERKFNGAPPFGKLIAVIISCENKKELMGVGREMAKLWETMKSSKVTLFGPAPAPISRIRNRYRLRFLFKLNKSLKTQDRIQKWLDRLCLPRSVRLTVDVDPISFY